jgi:dTDP-4-amino-4,6-dideoxygalactose transaminase
MLQKFLISDLPKAEDLLPQIRRIDQNRWYTNFGPLTTEFEQRMTALFSAADPYPGHGAIHLTTMVTGYHALEVGLRILGIPKGGKVLMPAVTFPACPLSVQLAGGEAFLADVDPHNWTLKPETARYVAAKMKLDAVMPVAVYGVPLSVTEWDVFSEETGIPVIIDAAAAIESQSIPKHGMVAHSLHATKPFGVGEGGLLVTRKEAWVRDARIYSNFGTLDRIATCTGSNTKMSEYHAAVGLAQAERWGTVKKRRREIRELYQKHLAPLADHLSLQPGVEKAVVSCLMLRLNKPMAAAVIARGLQANVALHKMYLPPLYHHPYFTDLAVVNTEGKILGADASLAAKAAHMMNSDMMLRHVLGVPFHPYMDEDDIAAVVDMLREAVAC